MQKQLTKALEEGIPNLVILGEDEVKQGVVKFKTLATREEVTLPRAGVAEFLAATLAPAPTM